MSPDTEQPPLQPAGNPGVDGGRLWTLLLIVAAVAGAMRVAVFCEALHRLPLLASAPDWLDMGTYDAWAQEIVGGDWLGRARGAFYQNALYPYLLAGLYALAGAGNVPAGIVMNGLFGVAGAVCAAGLGRRLFGWWAGLAAGLLAALNGSQLSVELLLLPDSLLPALFLGAVWFTVSGVARGEGEPPQPVRRWLLAGLLLGLATAGRGSNLLVAAVLCGWLLIRAWRAERLRLAIGAGVMGAGVWAVVIPLVLRNGLLFDLWTVSTNGPATLYLSNAPGATGYFGYPPRYDEVRRMALAAERPDAVWLGELGREIAREPGAFAMVMLRKVQLLLTSFDAPDNGNYYFARRYVASLRFLSFGPLFLYVVGAVGIVPTWCRRRELAPLYVTMLTLAGTLLIFHVAGRFKLPILSMLAVLGGGGVVALWRAAGGRRWGTVLVAALIAVAGACALWARPPVGLSYPGRRFTLRTQEFINHSVALLRAERVPEGVAMLEDGAELFPADPRFRERLAGVALVEGRFREALAHVEAGLSEGHRTEPLMRRRVEALALLGRREEALGALDELLARYPQSRVSPAVLRRLRPRR